MKIRNIPFGYCYQNGSIITHPEEEKVIKLIFHSYLNGESLLAISNELNYKNIEYMTGTTNWNKAKVKRIIEDKRYTGQQGYPLIVDTLIYEQVQELKLKRNTQKQINRQSDIYQIQVPVYCSYCGGFMKRMHNCRMKCKEKWICQNRQCKKEVQISDIDFIKSILEILNTIIYNPDLIQQPKIQLIESKKVCQLENEIFQMIEGYDFNKKILQQKALECAAIKYNNLSSTEYITNQLKADFEQSNPLSVFSSELFHKTVRAIQFDKSNKVNLILKNGQVINSKM